MIRSDLGIGIFCYNRPSHFKRVLISLEALEISELIIFIDGSKNETDKVNADYIKYIAKNSKIKKIKLILRKSNLGLSKSLTEGIRYLSKNFNKFIVLEDDCVVYKNCLNYFKYCLDEFENDDEINNVCTFQFREISKLCKAEYNLIKLNHFLPWAWGSWSAKWKKFEKSKIEIHQNIPLFLKNLNTKKYIKNKKQDIWSLKYIFYQYHNNMYSIFPSHTLSKNIGFDGSGVNSKASNFFTSSELNINKLNFHKKIDSNKIKAIHQRIVKHKYNLFY